MHSSDAFTPLVQSSEAAVSSRPSLSYWQDAWLRLQQNKRAIFSLYLIIGLLLFTFVGPFVWTCLLYTSPSPRDGRISRMPSSA